MNESSLSGEESDGCLILSRGNNAIVQGNAGGRPDNKVEDLSNKALSLLLSHVHRSSSHFETRPLLQASAFPLQCPVTPTLTSPTSETVRREFKMPSTLRSLSRRASQFLRRDRYDEEYQAAKHGDVHLTSRQGNGGGCLPGVIPIRKRTKKSPSPPQFSIAEESPRRDPAPQLPTLGDLGHKKVGKARSIAVIPRQVLASQDLAPFAIDAFRPRPSLDLSRTSVNMPGAFPSSSSPATERQSSIFQVSPLPSPLKLWLMSEKQLNRSSDTVLRISVDPQDRSSSFSVSLLPSPVKAWLIYDKRMNESSDTVIRHRPDSQQSTSGLLENVADMPRAESRASTWATTTEPDTEPGTPLERQPTPQMKSKANDHNNPYLRQSQQLGIDPSASTTSSIRQLPPNKHLRHQPKLPSERRWASLDEESYNSQMERAEQSALRRKFHLPSATSRSKLQWGDLSSKVSSLNSADARLLRKDLRLPSRRVSAPNLSGIRRTQEYVEGLSGEPEKTSYEPFFDSSEIRDEVFGDQGHTEQVFPIRKFTDETYHSNEREYQANNAFFPSNPGPQEPMQHKAIINNLYTAVQRVDTEMARVQLENRQLAQSEGKANNRAAFWEETAGGLEETLRQKEREREELVELMIERDIPIPQALLRKWEMEREERELETVQEGTAGEVEQDTGYDADVSAETEELYEAAGKLQ